MVKTTTSAINIDSFGVVHNTFKTRSAFKLVYIVEQANAINQILKGKKAPIVVNLANVNEINLTHCSSILNSRNLENASALAIVVNSRFQKNILNFWYRFKKKSCPLMVFTNQEEACVWLKSHHV